MNSTDSAAPPDSTTTTQGTPASPKWDPEWLAEVDRTETQLGHRICGAHTPAWTPCKLTSTHPNGRCRFHGGHPAIGAPNGNRNAWIHGLYSRRLQQCGDHCPLWNHCPMAGQDVLALTPPERPHCVYEQQEYEDTLSTFSLEKDKVEPKEINMETKTASPNTSKSSDPSHASHTSHQSPLRDSASPRETGLVERDIALLQVLLTRAQAALSIHRLTDETRASSRNNNYQLHTTRPSALLQAQLQIARELRHWLKLLPGFTPGSSGAAQKSKTPPLPPEPQGLPMRMLKVLEETEGFLEAALELKPGETNPFIPRLKKRTSPDAPPLHI